MLANCTLRPAYCRTTCNVAFTNRRQLSGCSPCRRAAGASGSGGGRHMSGKPGGVRKLPLLTRALAQAAEAAIRQNSAMARMVRTVPVARKDGRRP